MTLRPRFNADSADAPTHDATGRPVRADPRQDTLFAAVWALATLQALAYAGVDRVTVAETHGLAGLQNVEAGAAVWSPMAAVVAAVAELRGHQLLRLDTPDGVAAIAARSRDGLTVIVANLTTEQRLVRLQPAVRGAWRILRRTPSRGPADARWRGASVARADELLLGPYAIAKVVRS